MGEDRPSTPAAGRPARLAALNAAAKPVVTPSMLDCDFARIRDELVALKNAGAVAVHLDVMDGHFVENLSYGPPVIAVCDVRLSPPASVHASGLSPR